MKAGWGVIALLALAVALVANAAAQETANRDEYLRKRFPAWFEDRAPVRIVGNIYGVGPRGLGVFLIATPRGHILLDGGLPSSAPMIARNIRMLGFSLGDVRYLINSHAHYDHSGGIAALKEMTGAEFVASAADRPALEGGYYEGSEDDSSLAAPPVSVDRIIADGDKLELGGVTLTARLTPGHSPGCTSWETTVEEPGRMLTVLFFCSATVAANRLVGDPQYDGIVEDYRHSFAMARGWRPDVFLANHPESFHMEDKLARRAAGETDVFVDRGAFPAYIERLEAAFERELARQRAALANP